MYFLILVLQVVDLSEERFNVMLYHVALLCNFFCAFPHHA